VNVEIHRAGSQLMEVGLPEVRAATLYQNNLGATPAPELVTETGDQLEAARTTANDHDAWFARYVDHLKSALERAARTPRESLSYSAPASRSLSGAPTAVPVPFAQLFARRSVTRYGIWYTFQGRPQADREASGGS
jgi:hypothetical protein